MREGVTPRGYLRNLVMYRLAHEIKIAKCSVNPLFAHFQIKGPCVTSTCICVAFQGKESRRLSMIV